MILEPIQHFFAVNNFFVTDATSNKITSLVVSKNSFLGDGYLCCKNSILGY